MKTKRKKFIVWIDQINQTAITVRAKDPEEAAANARVKWRREYTHARVSYIEEQKGDAQKNEIRETHQINEPRQSCKGD